MDNIILETKQRLNEEAEEKYKKFSAALIPNVKNILGVRLPVLRKIAKEISKKDYLNYLLCKNYDYMEEKMLKGMIIGLIKDEPEKILPFIEEFISEIDNWAVCDTFCCGLKFTIKNKERVWNFLEPYLKSSKEYEIRFGCVMLLSYYVEEKYIDKIFTAIEKIRTEDYYAQMAIAWLISICFIKLPEKSMKFLKQTKIQKWIYNKAIQKIIESYRISPDTKLILKTMKR